MTYLHHDSLGSAQSGTDSSGAILWQEAYTPYGEALNDVSANQDLAGFTGHIKDDATGLSYMQTRYYDPVIGRFYSNDTVGFRDIHRFNRYAHANNNPYKYTNPDGRDAMISFNKNGSIQIDTPTKFSGTGVTQSNISSIKTAVSKAWSGTYNINGDSFVDGSDSGEWRTDTGGITDGAVAHEAGHLMGIDD
ncbi:RHS repeat-associated core domain-containing protein [Pseudidiomarina sp.]|uniref:RHS repeat-associated core domain-containing protein n=1 Tax=Pseudidiomarina sp. TaxID=2081707 RepID=UPI003A985828